jgi:antitoxin PrlF
MMASVAHKLSKPVEATVTSKGQVTLPREIRKHLGIQRGSRIRFSIPAAGAVKVEPVLYDLEDLWKIADQITGQGGVMTFEEMNAAKARRQW